MNEAELIKKLIAGEEKAFGFLIDNHKQNIFRTCIGFLHNKDDAEDLTQEVFIEVFRSVKFFKQNSILATWMYRIAVNKSLNYLKRKKNQGGFIVSIQQALGIKQIPSTSENPEQKVLAKEKKTLLELVLERLPENQTIAFTLAKYDDLSYKEIAEVMELSASSVESLIFRARENLRKELLQHKL